MPPSIRTPPTRSSCPWPSPRAAANSPSARSPSTSAPTSRPSAPSSTARSPSRSPRPKASPAGSSSSNIRVRLEGPRHSADRHGDRPLVRPRPRIGASRASPSISATGPIRSCRLCRSRRSARPGARPATAARTSRARPGSGSARPFARRAGTLAPLIRGIPRAGGAGLRARRVQATFPEQTPRAAPGRSAGAWVVRRSAARVVVSIRPGMTRARSVQ